MSGGHDVLSLKEDDVSKMLIAEMHVGAINVNYQMEQYIYKRRTNRNIFFFSIYYYNYWNGNFFFFFKLNVIFIDSGVNVINLGRTWEKLLLAARAIVAIEHPSEVFVISCRPTGQRAVLKFAAHTGATPIAGRFTPGAFTNQIQVNSC